MRYAYAVSKGYTVSTVPEAWTIHNGKLYLNYSLGVRSQFPGVSAAGDENWPDVLK